MQNMTGLGKYQKGLELEAQGLNGAQIAKSLGLKDAQAWYVTKSMYKKKGEAFNQRAAGEGFADGMKNLLPEVVAVAADIAAGLINAQAAYEDGKVQREVGRTIGDALLAGINHPVPALVQRAAALAEAAKAGIETLPKAEATPKESSEVGIAHNQTRTPEVERVADADKTLSQKPQAIRGRLKISVETKAVGEHMEYLLDDHTLLVARKGDGRPGMILLREEAAVMVEELRELLNA